MNGINNLSNAELIQAFHLAISLKLDADFIEILSKEITKRKLQEIDKRKVK
ncbi:sporulation histidine kinase inhibitor Sda [Niallia nealsonii]|uniref:sporulation histidine kinase inhibitor Sda n=1 Tax=Niallia nealsonii TaxID=115979 RepID=UPI001F2AE21E|nr:sporulation histidine kinase inhibitor Sda [Niallia nealsonii]